MTVNLSISLVVYQSDRIKLKETLQSLSESVLYAQKEQQLASCFLTVVDNYAAMNEEGNHDFENFISEYWFNSFQLLKPEKNLGYGLGHNFAILDKCESLHLVINPDVFVDRLAIINAIELMKNHTDVGLLTPSARKPSGEKEYLCKSYPSVLVLLLRGFAPQGIKNLFSAQLAHYELRSMPEIMSKEVILASGCFMFFRGETLKEIQGFSPDFFLYFEDFDLTLRLKKTWNILYAPSVTIIHHGGYTAKKGCRHIGLFLHSAWMFFNLYGWKFI